MLTVTPDNAIRVSFAAHGRRSTSKDVRLPLDAVLSEITAKFQADDSEDENQGVPMSKRGVSSLEVAVGRAVPQQPKHIDIL